VGYLPVTAARRDTEDARPDDERRQDQAAGREQKQSAECQPHRSSPSAAEGGMGSPSATAGGAWAVRFMPGISLTRLDEHRGQGHERSGDEAEAEQEERREAEEQPLVANGIGIVGRLDLQLEPPDAVSVRAGGEDAGEDGDRDDGD